MLPYHHCPSALTKHSPRNRPRTFVHILDDDSLLNIFYFCRPVDEYANVGDDRQILQGGQWHLERWWYKFVRVCRRWRHIILASPTFLGLCIVCTPYMPVAAMLANYPLLPIIIDDTYRYHNPPAKGEEGVLLALQQRERVRRIRISVPDRAHSRKKRLVMAIDHEFPMLEYFYFALTFTGHLSGEASGLTLPDGFRAPSLRHLVLFSLTLSIHSPAITSAVGLVTLSLLLFPPFTRFHPNDLLQLVSLMPQLETLDFRSDVSVHDLKSQLSHMPITSHAALPKLRWFGFNGSSAYLEALLPRITAPLLDKLQLVFVGDLAFPLPELYRFVGQTESLRCGSAKLSFLPRAVSMRVWPCEGAEIYAVKTIIFCGHTRQKMSFAAQICNALRMPLSKVEHLSLVCGMSPTRTSFDGTNRLECREILRSFSNLKTLRVPTSLVGVISSALQPQDGELSIELLPQLRELACSWNDYTHSSFAQFIHARQRTGCPVTLVH